MLVGRDAELEVIDGLLDRARAGRGGAAVVHGEPGIGKTALLDHTALRATGMCVLRSAGVESESELGHSTAHRLLLPLLDRVGELPEPQARALDVVFGRAAAPVPDRFLVALSVLTLLSVAATDEPVLCLVDDAQWADRPSLDALVFAARRLAAEPMLILLASRSTLDGAGLLDIPLGGLDDDAARTLLRARVGPGLSSAGADELLVATAGNPLAIRELPPEGIDRGPGPVPLADDLRRAFLRRARHHGPAAQRLLLLIAADGTGRLETVRQAVAPFGIDPSELTGPMLDGLDDLIVTDGPCVAFRHPLMRAAVYHQADGSERRAAHRALAVALHGESTEIDRRAWHLGQAAVGRDEGVAADLERSAERALGRAGPGAAAAALTRAAELTAPGPERARRLVRAAGASWDGGDVARATRLLDHAEQDGSPVGATRVALIGLRALIELRVGFPDAAVDILRPVLGEALAGDPRRAIELLMLLGEASYHADAAEAWAVVVDGVERLQPTGDVELDPLIRLIRGVCRVRAGSAAGLSPGDGDAVERQVTDPGLLCWAGGLFYGVGQQERGRRLRRAAMVRARAAGAVGTLAWVLEFVANDEIVAGRLGSAEAFAEEGRRHAIESGQRNLACWYLGSLALIAALRGQEERTRVLVAAVRAEAVDRGLGATLVLIDRSLGLLDLGTGRPAEAMEHFRPTDSTHPGIVLMNVPELIECAVRLGRVDEVADPLRRYSRWAEVTRAPAGLAVAARCRALVASGPAAEAEFRTALGWHDHGGWPLERARTRLLYGEFLRRERRRADAREPLRAALAAFERIGSPAWADRARAELRATGETTGTSAPGALAQLTPQELRIATAVGEGGTNRDIAAALFLSPRTVDYHLRKIFQKAGIVSRSDLIRMVLAAS